MSRITVILIVLAIVLAGILAYTGAQEPQESAADTSEPVTTNQRYTWLQQGLCERKPLRSWPVV